MTDSVLRPDGEMDWCIADLFCIWFPRICRSVLPGDPLGPYPPFFAWGGPGFTIQAEEIPAAALFHNACLTAWRTADRSPEGMLAAMEDAALETGVNVPWTEERRALYLGMFQAVLNGDIPSRALPTHQDIMDSWRLRPTKGPFADDQELGRLLERLGDGIDHSEVTEWNRYAATKAKAPLREYWTAACMAASVSWWYEFSQEVGENCSFGVFADLMAMRQTTDPYAIGIASVTGLVVDFITHFWPQD